MVSIEWTLYDLDDVIFELKPVSDRENSEAKQ